MKDFCHFQLQNNRQNLQPGKNRSCFSLRNDKSPLGQGPRKYTDVILI